MLLREAGTEVKHRHLHGREKANPSQGGQRHTVHGQRYCRILLWRHRLCGHAQSAQVSTEVGRPGGARGAAVADFIMPESAGLPESKIADKPEKAFVETPGKS